MSRIVSEFDRRGWRKHHEVLPALVREAVQGSGDGDYKRLSKMLTPLFLSANGTSRAEVGTALERALKGARIVPGLEGPVSETHIYGDRAQVLIGRNEVTSKKITINNRGQFAGNIDSSNSEVKIGSQQQALLADQQRLLEDQMDRPEIKAIVLEPTPAEEKRRAIGSKLNEWTGIALDVTTDFAAKFLAEIVKPR